MNPVEIPLPAMESLQLLSLEITGKCNLTCSHCYAESGPRLALRGDMAKEDWLRVIDDAAEIGCRSITFIGGEPTLHPDLPAMIERVAGHGFGLIEVFTNATHLKPALIECFSRHGVSLAVSFYSVDAAIHEEITGVAGSWQRTVDGLEVALAAGLKIRIGIVELAANRGQSEATTEFLQQLGLRQIRVDRLREVGRGEAATGFDGDSGEGDGEGERFSELCGHCWEGKLCVTSSGETFPCVFSRRTQLGNAKAGLESILSEPQLHAFRAKVRHLASSTQDPGNCGPSGSRQPDCGPSGSRDQPDCGPSGSSVECGPSGGSENDTADFEVPAGCGPSGSN